MDCAYTDLAARIQAVYTIQPRSRLLVAVAGPPGSGKSTIAAKVVQILNESASKPLTSKKSVMRVANVIGHAVAISVDGYHFPRKYLDTLPNSTEAYSRRGAPWTFDVQGILGFVRELRHSTDVPLQDRHTITAPSFDHSLKDPVENDVRILPTDTIVILEGNYLLLDVDEWRDISKQMDLRIFVDVDVNIARARVAKRHVQAGIENNFEGGLQRFDANDAPNGDLIRHKLTSYDIRVVSLDAT